MAILDTQVLKGMLENFTNSFSEVGGAAIVSRDGLIMVSTYEDGSYNEKLGAMTTATLNPAKISLEELGLGSEWASINLGTKGGILIKEIDDDMVLSVIVQPGAKIGQIVGEMNRLVAEIGG